MKNEAQYYQELGQRIQRVRRQQNLTQENLASLVGLSRTSVVNIERGRQKVLAHILVRLAAALKVGLADLAPQLNTTAPIDELVQDLSEPVQRFVRSAVPAAKAE